MSSPRNSLRPQDILIALKVVLFESQKEWSQLKVAQELGISPSEVAFAFERLKTHHLMNQDKRSIKRAALFEFLIHGLKYVFPATIGAQVRGIPTAVAYGVLKDKIRLSADQILVWPDSEGKVRGQSISPLYDSVPFAVKGDEHLHQLLSLIDAIRVGGAREKNLAEEEIKKILLGKVAT